MLENVVPVHKIKGCLGMPWGCLGGALGVLLGGLGEPLGVLGWLEGGLGMPLVSVCRPLGHLGGHGVAQTAKVTICVNLSLIL